MASCKKRKLGLVIYILKYYKIHDIAPYYHVFMHILG